MRAMDSSDLLTSIADEFASVVPAVDAEAEHDRWQAGIGPFEEERQVEMLRDTIDADQLASGSVSYFPLTHSGSQDREFRPR
jgi:hypothetical protein